MCTHTIIGFDHGLPCRVKKTWLLGLSNCNNLGLRPRFLSTESPGQCFSHDMGPRWNPTTHMIWCDHKALTNSSSALKWKLCCHWHQAFWTLQITSSNVCILKGYITFLQQIWCNHKMVTQLPWKSGVSIGCKPCSKTCHVGSLTTHLLSVERADWPKLHDTFKARDMYGNVDFL